jgi:hypothetical protein
MEPVEWIIGGAAVVWLWDRLWPAAKGKAPKATPKPETDDD